MASVVKNLMSVRIHSPEVYFLKINGTSLISHFHDYQQNKSTFTNNNIHTNIHVP